jgi:hypothetical protein
MPVPHSERKRLALVRLIPAVPASSEVYIDLLFALTGIEDLVVEQAERIEILPGRVAPVACLGHLIALKVLSASEGLLKHQVDLRALLAQAGPGDLALARDAVATIVSRGRNEGRDLQQDLDRHLSEQRSQNDLRLDRSGCSSALEYVSRPLVAITCPSPLRVRVGGP